MPELLQYPSLEEQTLDPQIEQIDFPEGMLFQPEYDEVTQVMPVEQGDAVLPEPGDAGAIEQPPQPETPTLHSRIFRHVGRIAAVAAAGLGFAFGTSTVDAAPAEASSDKVYTTTDNVYLHADPGLGDKGDLIKLMPRGTRFTADCYVNDTPIGEKNNPAWLHGTDETGATGYFTDAYSDSHWSRNNTLHDQGLAFCGEEKKKAQEHAPEMLNPNFNRMAGVRWAIDNARQPQENGIQCTWFVSNALWNAGLLKTEKWTDEGGYWSRGQHFEGTIAAHAAPKLVEYLKDNYSATWEGLGSINNYNVPLAQAGDIIAYDWEDDGHIDHLALVVGHSEKNPDYPLVAEWGQFDWSGLAAIKNNVSNPKSPYTERGWNWSEKNSRWLAEGYPNATAHLLHINGGYIAPKF